MDPRELRRLVIGQEIHDAGSLRKIVAASKFEQDTVGAVLRILRFDKTWPGRLRDWAKSRYGVPHLYAEAFNTLVPEFHYWLGVSDLNGVKLHLDKSCTPPRLWTNFEASPFALAYFEQVRIKRLQAADDARKVAFVVPRVGVPGGLIVRVPDDLAEPGFAWVWIPPEDTDHQSGLPSLVIQPFTTYLNHLRQQGWRPPQPEREHDDDGDR